MKIICPQCGASQNIITVEEVAKKGGTKSAKVRAANGHDSKYYSDLAKKRWSKINQK